MICENYSIHNGLGSAVAEVLVESCPVPMRRVGVKERYGQVGTQDFLEQAYGLTTAAIVAAARELLSFSHKKSGLLAAFSREFDIRSPD